MFRFFSLMLLIGIIYSCSEKKKNAEKPVARVYEDYLYPSDLREAIPPKISPADSTLLASDYIDKWIRKQLLLRKSELNLSDQDKNVEKQIENYRSSLLIFKYEQNIIMQQLDTIVSKKEIEEYYKTNSSNYLLNKNIVKALFLQLPRQTPEMWNVRRWYRSENSDDIKKLDAFAFQHAKKYDYFNDNWVDFNEIENALPVKLYNIENYLRYRKSFEVMDSVYFYMVNIKDFKLIGDITPLELVENDIHNIIINKRKIQLINKLEANIYNDALNYGYFTIY